MAHVKTPHPHAAMMKAYADDTSLCAFVKFKNDSKWHETSRPFFDDKSCYFLCLPKHKEACLHWLNGGNTEFNAQYSDGWYEPTTTWSLGSVFMQDDYQLRIKPRKERLWIAVKTDKHEHLGGCRKVRICSHAFVNKQDAEEYLDLSDSQLIEIEVEV